MTSSRWSPQVPCTKVRWTVLLAGVCSPLPEGIQPRPPQPWEVTSTSWSASGACELTVTVASMAVPFDEFTCTLAYDPASTVGLLPKPLPVIVAEKVVPASQVSGEIDVIEG